MIILSNNDRNDIVNDLNLILSQSKLLTKFPELFLNKNNSHNFLKIDVNNDSDQKLSKEQIEGLIKIYKTLAMNVISKFILSTFSQSLDVKTIPRMKKMVYNKKFYSYIENNINNILEKHPNYLPCSFSEFKETLPYERFLSRFKDKTNKERIIQIGKISIDWLLDIKIIPLMIKCLLRVSKVPIPINEYQKLYNIIIQILNPFIKTLLNGIGISFNTGTLNNKLFTFKKFILEAGIELSPKGFRLVNLRVYFFKIEDNDKNLISVQIPNPPIEIYNIPDKKIDENLKQFLAMNNKELKKELYLINNGGK